MRLTLADLEEFCRSATEESVGLEFKVCNELRPGIMRRGKSVSRDEVVQELSKDVSSFLNAGGGTIIYGIREKNSRAAELDKQDAFKAPTDPRPEKLLQWIRAHISPSPAVDVYSVQLHDGNRKSPWLLVVDIPQGQEAHMAKDKRFYRRTGNTSFPMEQYEVADVMRRSGSASLDLQLTAGQLQRNWFADEKRERASVSVRIAVTSRNYVSSEYGAVRIVLAPPLVVDPIILLGSFAAAQLEKVVAIAVGNAEVRGEALKIRWGANLGNIVYPGDWYDFWGNSIRIEVPCPKPAESAIYAFKVEIFTVNAPPRRLFYLLRRSAEDEISIERVEAAKFEEVVMRSLPPNHAGGAVG